MRKLLFSASIGLLALPLVVMSTVRGEAPPAAPAAFDPPTFQPPPPPPAPCPPVCPTATPTVTPTPTPTATPVPLTLREKLAHGTVNPRSKQKVTVTTLPGAIVSITVKFPNGDTKKHAGTAGTSGTLTWSYIQPGSRITHSSRTARVSVVATTGTQTKSSTKRYTIGYARLDISVQPRSQKRDATVGIWLHTGASTPVEVVMRFKGGRSQILMVNNRSSGWSYTPYTVPANAPKGRVDVKGYNLARSYPGSGETSYQVK